MKAMKDIMALIPTPLTDNYEVDEDSLRRLIDFEMENGCSGVGVLAAIGEGYLIPHEGWRKVIEIAVKHMDGRAPLMAGCPTMGTLHAVQLCKEAEDLGADAILGFNPQGFRSYSNEELVTHYKAITDAVKIPIAPYSRAVDPVPFEVLKALVADNRISYIKYAYQNAELLSEMAQYFGDDLFIFCGADTLTLRYMLLGCRGVLTATVAMLPKEHVNLLKMVNEGDIDGARAYYYQAISAWNDIAFHDMNTWHALHKIALKEMGVIKTATVLQPQGSPIPYQVDEVKWFVKHYGKKK